MTERPKSRWGQILSGVSVSGPPDQDNVIPMRQQSLDELNHQCKLAQNEVISRGVDVDRAVIAYRTALDNLSTARERMKEQLRTDSCFAGDFTQQFPEIDAP